jgi:hypothetical protein
MTKEELIEAIIAKFTNALGDPIAVAETMFTRYVSQLPYDKYNREEHTLAIKTRTKALVWFSSQGFPGLLEKLEKTQAIGLYAENNRKVEEVLVGYEDYYLNLFIDGGREQYWVPDFDFRKQPQSVIDAYEAATAPVEAWWQNALAPLAEAWGKKESAAAAEKAAEKIAQETKEAYEKSLGDKIRTALTAWAAGMAAKQTKWEDYLRFHAAGGSAVDCRGSASFWPNLGVEVAELDVRVSNDDGTYLRVETSYPLTGADTTEHLRRRNPEALSAQEAKEVLKQWETEQIPMIGVLEAAKAAEAKAAEAERLATVKTEIERCDSLVGYYLAHFNILSDCFGHNAAPSLGIVDEADEGPDQVLQALQTWLKLAETRWKYIQRAAEEAASLLIKTIEVVEVEDEDDAPHQNPVTVVGNTMYTVTVPAESVWSCSVDDTEDFDEDIYKKAGEVADQYGDMHIVFYRPRKTDRRGGRNGRR